ncbi:RidA family protein [Candidatus Acetothermia bacterium]|nr:RidA family protein [Candidatus Acetothermia bacterium]MBI3644151.1 RidA family protein [Candidatus Acetothermia bacterium]
MKILQPKEWLRPSGYSNGIEAEGKVIFVAGQVGWNAKQQFESDDFVDQVRQTLKNVLAVLKESRAGPENITRLTWFIVDKREYKARSREVGEVYRELLGKHFPAMTLVEVSALLEDGAKVEIEATAVLSK